MSADAIFLFCLIYQRGSYRVGTVKDGGFNRLNSVFNIEIEVIVVVEIFYLQATQLVAHGRSPDLGSDPFVEDEIESLLSQPLESFSVHVPFPERLS